MEVEKSHGPFGNRWIGSRLSLRSPGTQQIHGMALRFPFNPRITATTVLPSRWEPDGRLQLPAIINAPDYGQMLFTADPANVSARLEGNYAKRIVDFVVEW